MTRSTKRAGKVIPQGRKKNQKQKKKIITMFQCLTVLSLNLIRITVSKNLRGLRPPLKEIANFLSMKNDHIQKNILLNQPTLSYPTNL